MAEAPYSPINVGERILRVRKAHGLTKTDFARMCDISRVALFHWEAGKQRPKIDAAAKIVAVFGLTLDYLYLGDTGTLRRSERELLNNSSEDC